MNIKLNAKIRDKNTESDKTIPAVVYGPNCKNRTLSIDSREFFKTYNSAGKSTLIDLSINEKDPVKVLIQDAQRDPVSDEFIHADFYELDMNKKLTVDFELIYEGIEDVEKATGGEVIKNLSTLQVECLPKDLVKEMTINISDKLKEIGDSMNASEVKLPEGLELISDSENSIVSVQEIKEEIIEAPVVEETEGEEGEKKEGEEGEEGEKKEGEEKPAEGKEEKPAEGAKKE
jgi:large subunit ribosomal protein L25